MTLGQKIAELRDKSGLSLRALGEKANINFSQLGKIENEYDPRTGGAPMMTIDALTRLCNALEYDLVTFLEETGYIEKKSPTVALVEDERETYIIDIFRALPPNLQKIMIAQAEGIVDNYGIKVEHRKAQGVS